MDKGPPIDLRAIAACAALVTAVAAFAGDDAQAPANGMLSRGRTFSEQGGESLYANACAGCHMRDARGAVGAGSYPSLVDDRNLAGAGYTLRAVVAGLRGMPAIGRAMTDDQVAAVVNYVRTHFGNRYDDAVTPDDVRQARP